MGSRAKLDLYAEFLSLLHRQKNPYLFLPYYQEIYEEFLDLFIPENLQYRPPQYLDDLGAYCATMQDSGLKELNDPVFKIPFQELDLRRTAVHFYMGDVSRASTRLNLKLKDYKPNSIVNNHEKFLELYAYILHSGSSIPEQMEKIRTEWAEMTAGTSADTVWIPLVEKGQIESESGLITATIQPLKVEVELRRGDATRDLIFFNNHPMGHNDLIYYQALDAVSVARSHLKNITGGKTIWFWVIFGFPDTGYFYTGESFGLGMALAVLAQMQKVTIQRTQHKILKNAVITGGVDVNGKVRGISELSLPAKIEAFHYSPFQAMVYPEINSGVLRETTQKLETTVEDRDQVKRGRSQKPYAKGNQTSKPTSLKPPIIQTFPVSELSTVLKNENIIKKQTITLKEWSRAHIRKNQVLRYAATILLLVGVTWGGWFFTRDLNPTNAHIDGKYLIATNSVDKMLWNYKFENNLSGNYTVNGAINSNIVIADIDGDVMNEIIIGLKEVGDNDGALYVFNSDGTVRWTYNEHPSPTFGDSTNNFDNSFVNIFILVEKHEISKERKRIIAGFNHKQFFPSRIIQFEEDGKIVGEYWNSGHLYGARLVSKFFGQEQRVLIYGTNNEYNTGFIAVFDLDSIQGHSPQENPVYTLDESFQGSQLAYLRFPALDTFQITRHPSRLSISRIDHPKNMTLEVHENAGVGDADIVYRLDNKLNVSSMYLSDSFKVLFTQYRGFDILNKYPWFKIYSHLTSLEYWDGNTWQKSSTL